MGLQEGWAPGSNSSRVEGTEVTWQMLHLGNICVTELW